MVRIRRHRLFESNVAMWGVPCAHGQNADILSVVGHSEGSRKSGPGYLKADKQAAMGIDWMNRDELSEAIPPAYTSFIGEQLMRYVRPDVSCRCDDSSPAHTRGTSACPGRRTDCLPSTGDPADSASYAHSPRSTCEDSAWCSPESSRGRDAAG